MVRSFPFVSVRYCQSKDSCWIQTDVAARDPLTLAGLRLMRAGLPNMTNVFFERTREIPEPVSYELDTTGLTAFLSKGGWTNTENHEMIHFILTFQRNGQKILPTLHAYVKGQQTVNNCRDILGLIIDYFIASPVSIGTKDMP
ncbi:hypothetical protein TRAPUB_6770 [Trametes pubescens]|uniref:Uncharacterized protein n=1 Tax=Trametes pubescens TaxID=154538 RepID=A0A1M2V5E1_TRAPU|nr:hypothetical protein TRAPUB_6770 [Trametes pubescens]